MIWIFARPLVLPGDCYVDAFGQPFGDGVYSDRLGHYGQGNGDGNGDGYGFGHDRENEGSGDDYGHGRGFGRGNGNGGDL